MNPFTLTWTIRQVAADKHTKVSQMTISVEQQNIYVDDLLKSLDSTLMACQLFTKMKALFVDSGFRLTKWSTNIPDILSEIPVHDHAHMARNCYIHSFNSGAQGAMELNWLPERDLLTLLKLHGDREKKNTEHSKCAINLLSFLGYTSTHIFKGKLIFQEL